MQKPTESRQTGVTVMPEYLQNEGVDAVLDRLAASGVTMVATSPYVMEPASETTGSREPPIDAGAGAVRLLDRPLWGKRELFVSTAPSFNPDRSLYRGLPYQPAAPTPLTTEQGGVIASFIRAAHSRHMKAYLQIQAAIPPGYRVQFGGPVEADKPRLPDGSVPPRRLSNNGSLASPQILDYTIALIRDLLKAYPDIDGFRLDWPEYPPYFLDDVFLDFSPHVRAKAKQWGFDMAMIEREVLALYRLLHGGLRNEHLERWKQADGGRGQLLALLLSSDGTSQWLRLKAKIVRQFLLDVRQAIPSKVALMLGVFPPPFHFASGMRFGGLEGVVTAFHLKFYTMHWPVILRFYGDQLMKNNPGLDETLLVSVLVDLLQIEDPPYGSKLSDYGYPEPDEAHRAGERVQLLKLADAQSQAGATPVFAFVHGYGPVEDFARRLAIGRRASPRGVWINRYGYLRDEKIRAIGKIG